MAPKSGRGRSKGEKKKKEEKSTLFYLYVSFKNIIIDVDILPRKC